MISPSLQHIWHQQQQQQMTCKSVSGCTPQQWPVAVLPELSLCCPVAGPCGAAGSNARQRSGQHWRQRHGTKRRCSEQPWRCVCVCVCVPAAVPNLTSMRQQQSSVSCPTGSSQHDAPSQPRQCSQCDSAPQVSLDVLNMPAAVLVCVCVCVSLALQRKRAAEAAGREAHFQQLYSEVLGGLEHGSGVLSDAQEVLQYAEAAQQARREELYQQWHSQVFEPIQVRSHRAQETAAAWASHPPPPLQCCALLGADMMHRCTEQVSTGRRPQVNAVAVSQQTAGPASSLCPWRAGPRSHTPSHLPPPRHPAPPPRRASVRQCPSARSKTWRHRCSPPRTRTCRPPTASACSWTW